jgi:cytoskeletal protein RodZ
LFVNRPLSKLIQSICMASSQFNLIDTPAVNEAVVVNTIEELVARRNQLGMSLETLAQQLRLPPKQLQLIEAGQYSDMSSLAFARAVLRSYGKAVGVDASPISKQVGTYAEAAELHNASTINHPVESRGMMGFGQAGSGSKWAWGGLIVAAIALAAFFLGPQQGNLKRIAVTTPVNVNPEIASASAGKPAASAAPVAAQTHADLKFEVQRAAWVEVTHIVDGAETTQVFSKSGTEPQNFLINVKLPANVTIGNADAVRMTRDGNEVDIKAFAQAGLAKVLVE